MLAIRLGQRPRLLVLVSVATLVVLGGTLAPSVAGAQAVTVRTCQGGGAGYKVTVPPENAVSTAGADPEELAAANCTIGYHEKKGFPFSLIGVCLIVTAAALTVAYATKGRFDLPGASPGTAFNVTGGDA